MINYLLIFTTVFATVIGQIILKYGESSLHFPEKWGLEEIFYAVLNNFLNIHFLSAIFFAMIGAVSWTLAIQKFNISFAYPFMALSYVLIVLAGLFLFNETMGIYQTIGTILIVTGIIFIGLR